MDDAHILALYYDRDPEALEHTRDKYGNYCFTIAYHILQNREDAEECVNDTWLHAWNAIPPQQPVSLQMFLAKIVRNLSYDRFRTCSAQKRGGQAFHLVLDELAECLPGHSDVASEYEGKELLESMQHFVKALPVREGNIFLRRYFFAEPVAVIAKRYALRKGNVTVILHRTRKKLKQHLQKEGFLDECK